MAKKIQEEQLSTSDKFLQLYLEAKFDTLHEKIDDVDTSVKELTTFVDALRMNESARCATCINSAEIKNIRKQVDEVMFIKKYWKPLLAGTILLFLLSAFGASAIYMEAKSFYYSKVITVETTK